MLKVVLFLVLLFAVLLVLRAARLFLAALFGPPRRRPNPPAPIAGDMVRDPVCGLWIDRRLALAVGTGEGAPAVCSEACRSALVLKGERPPP